VGELGATAKFQGKNQMTKIYFATNRNLISSDDLEGGFDFGSNFSNDGLANFRSSLFTHSVLIFS
jgi:hypothetical protein